MENSIYIIGAIIGIMLVVWLMLLIYRQNNSRVSGFRAKQAVGMGQGIAIGTGMGVSIGVAIGSAIQNQNDDKKSHFQINKSSQTTVLVFGIILSVALLAGLAIFFKSKLL